MVKDLVIVDVEKTPYRVAASREFCARPFGWTLKPSIQYTFIKM